MASKDKLVNNKKARDWRQRNPEGAKSIYLKYKYGITLDQYNEMFLAQNGVCAICGNSETYNKRSLAVDHDHITGVVRGLLCLDCNAGIGHLKDNPEYLQNAITYLSNQQINSTR